MAFFDKIVSSRPPTRRTGKVPIPPPSGPAGFADAFSLGIKLTDSNASPTDVVAFAFALLLADSAAAPTDALTKLGISGSGFADSSAAPSDDNPVLKVVYTASGTFDVPADVTTLTVECWGGGGGGGGGGTLGRGGGGGGGRYSRTTLTDVTPGIKTVTIGAAGTAGAAGANGGVGGDSWFDSTSVILAKGSTGGVAGGTTGGAAGAPVAGSIGTVQFTGGSGAAGGVETIGAGGGGGGAGDANNGATATTATGGAGGAANGGAGGTGGASTAGTVRGGGGGGGTGSVTSPVAGKAGARGEVRISWTHRVRVLVSGAGTFGVDGIYTWRGTSASGRPYYNLVGQPDSETNSSISAIDNQWIIYGSVFAGALYEESGTSNVGFPWMVSVYVAVGTGADPAPTVTEYP